MGNLGGLYLGGTVLGESEDVGERKNEHREKVTTAHHETNQAKSKPSRQKVSSTAPSTKLNSKPARIIGGLAAVPRAVTLDYDSDDALILDLKQKGHSDAYVAQRLADEGRIRYKPKTVSSRWLRLRKLVDKAKDDQLDDEVEEWYAAEDKRLLETVDVVSKQFDREFERLAEKKWRTIADKLAQDLSKQKFSSNACRERFEELQNGTGLPPIDQDPNQEGRRQMREDRLAEIKRARDAEIEEEQRVQREHEQQAQEKIEQAQAKADLIELQKRQRETDKVEEQRVREEKKAAQEQVRKLRATIREADKKEKEDRAKERQLLDALYRTMTGKSLTNRRGAVSHTLAQLRGTRNEGNSTDKVHDDSSEVDEGEEYDVDKGSDHNESIDDSDSDLDITKQGRLNLPVQAKGLGAE